MSRRPFRPRPFQSRFGTPDAPVLGRATVLDNGLIGEKPASRTALENARGFPNPSVSENDLYALNSLQMRRDWPLEALSVQIPIEYLRDNLAPVVRQRTGIAMCGSPYVFNCTEENVDRRIRKMFGRWPEFWNTFRTSEYVFWPIEAERGYFVTGIFHMEKGSMDDPDFDPEEDPEAIIPQVLNPHYTVVEGWSVVDAERSQTADNRVTRVRNRIQRIFAAEGMTFKLNSYREHRLTNGQRFALPWVPPPLAHETWSSGIRSFALVRQLLQRILDFHCLLEGHQDTFFSDPTCGWLNVDQVRYEMMGICAINVLEDMDWNARLSIECIRSITTVEGIDSFGAPLLGASDLGKEAYIPESDQGRSVTAVP
ncbi:hypothetical protein F5Y19DRAFT_472798 [Xylariaceae sp. FL1651]|nr:hypothetical protein F5Y19DRAFT_472798 [Xylariaceae sp. FL1651]